MDGDRVFAIVGIIISVISLIMIIYNQCRQYEQAEKLALKQEQERVQQDGDILFLNNGSRK